MGPALAAAPAQTVEFFAIDRLQLEPEPAAQAAWLRRMPRPSVNPIGSTMLGAFLRNARRAFLAHRRPKRGAGASSFALSCQTSLFVFGAKARQGAKKNPLAQRILFFLFGAAQAGPPDRSLPEAGRPAPPGGGYFKTAMKLSAMRSTLRLFKPATHMRPLLTM